MRGTEVELEEGEVVVLLLDRREAEEVVRGAGVGVGPEGRVGAAEVVVVEEEEGLVVGGLAMGAATALGLEEESKEAKKSSSGAAEAEEAGATLVTPSMKRLLGNLREEEKRGQLEAINSTSSDQASQTKEGRAELAFPSSLPSLLASSRTLSLGPRDEQEDTDLLASSSFLLSSSSFQRPATLEVYFCFPS